METAIQEGVGVLYAYSINSMRTHRILSFTQWYRARWARQLGGLGN